MPNKSAKKKPSAFNLYMKEELKKLKKEMPKLDHNGAFKMAAQNWKNVKHSFKVPKNGQTFLKRKNRKDFVTHKGDKFFHRKGHRSTHNKKGQKKKPYHKKM